MPTEPDDHLLNARQASGRPEGRWGRRIATATAIYHLGRQGWQLTQRWRQQRSYMVTVIEGDETYDLVQALVLDMMPASRQRALVAHTITRRPASNVEDLDTPTRQIALGYDGTRTQKITLDGHTIDVRVERDEASTVGTDSFGASTYSYKPHKIMFVAPDLAARDAVVAFLQGIADSLGGDRRLPKLIAAARWGDWRVLRDLPPRSLDSVILPAGHLDGITADLRQFLASETRYATYGIPWTRGYLFHGPPGTGKTSTARALSASLGLDVYFLSLSDLDNDAALNQLIGQVPPRAVLLLEDVDVAHAATDRDDTRKGVTLSGVLNALDGVVTPHGLIKVLTTNDRTQLDPALIRPGRADYEIEMTYLVPEQMTRLVDMLTGIPLDPSTVPTYDWPRITAAEVVGAVTEHMHNPELAHLACVELLARRLEQVYA
jgi:hypothetical protein